MRALSYKVMKKDGTIFETSNYQQAIAEGRIIEHLLTEIDETSKETREYRKKHADKIARVYNIQY